MTGIVQSCTAGGHLVREEGGVLSLTGSRCCQCSEKYFPRVNSCTRCCSSDVEPYDLGSSGVLWSWTVQSFLPKSPYNSGETAGSFKPYGVGYVEMACGVKVEARLTTADAERLEIGMPMVLSLIEYGQRADGEPLTTFGFTPDQA